MKFLDESDRTQLLLKHWLPESKLLYGSFYFCRDGSELQRTHTGVLRSLIHQALSQNPELAKVIFSGLFENDPVDWKMFVYLPVDGFLKLVLKPPELFVIAFYISHQYLLDRRVFTCDLDLTEAWLHHNS